MIELIAIPVMAMLDRMRGGLFTGPNPPDKFPVLRKVRPWMWALAMGVVAGLILRLSPEWLAVCAVAFMFGERISWGYPMALALGLQPAGTPEWWQKGILLDNEWAALAFRGALWGLIPAVATMGQAWLLVPCMALSMPLAAYIATKTAVNSARWKLQEYIRGGLFALLLVMGTYYGAT